MIYVLGVLGYLAVGVLVTALLLSQTGALTEYYLDDRESYGACALIWPLVVFICVLWLTVAGMGRLACLLARRKQEPGA